MLAKYAAMVMMVGSAGAHEIGTTRVSANFHEGRTYEIVIVTDGASLAEKLAASRGGPAPPDVRPGGLETLLSSSDGQFRRRLRIAFDDAEANPAIAYSVSADGGSGPLATIR